MKRILAFALALLVCVVLLASCKKRRDFDTPSGCWCEDCFDFIVRRFWRHEVGDVVDRV